MFVKRHALGIGVLLLSLGLAFSAQAEKFSVTGGGGQLHIGNGLALPIQQAATSAVTGTNFPTLLVPAKSGSIVTGTIAKPFQSAGGKQGYQRKLSVPTGVLSKPAAQTTVGVKFSNPTAFAVATNLNYVWPAAPAVFSTGAAVATTTVAGFGGTLKYSNALAARFGGAAQFSLAPGVPGGFVTSAPVTLYIKINASTPPCAGCVAGIIIAKPTGLGGAGAPTGTTVSTPGGAVAPNLALVTLGTSPSGTIIGTPVPIGTTPLPTNAAMSQGGPWTTGQLIISNPAAGGGTEKFTLSGKDSRTADGGGTIQMVSGSVSSRAATGANANRGWVQLNLKKVNETPALSPLALGAVAGLMVLAGGYATRRKLAGNAA